MNKSTQSLKQRPVYLNLRKIRMPVMAVVSILHRLSGVAMVLLLPVFIYLFDQSLRSESAYNQVVAQLSSFPAQCVAGVTVWMISHHLCAGIRFLLIDIDIGLEKDSARIGAWLVNITAIVLTLFVFKVML